MTTPDTDNLPPILAPAGDPARKTQMRGIALLLMAIVVFSMVHSPEQLVSLEYGTVRVSNILQRLLLLGIMTTITAAVTYRMQRLVELSGNVGINGLRYV